MWESDHTPLSLNRATSSTAYLQGIGSFMLLLKPQINHDQLIGKNQEGKGNKQTHKRRPLFFHELFAASHIPPPQNRKKRVTRKVFIQLLSK